MCSVPAERARLARALSGTLRDMNRRHFLRAATTLSSLMVLGSPPAETKDLASPSKPMDLKQFHASRRFLGLPSGRVAYVERGRGPAALFLHGYPLNGYQWRGAFERLSSQRRCIAADFLGLGYTEAPARADLTPKAQLEMLVQLLDLLGEHRVDIVASDSGGSVAQLLAAYHPQRVRSLLLTNCDSSIDSPPKAIIDLIEDVRRGVAAEKYILQPLKDRALARSPQGLIGACFTYPDKFLDETLDCYLGPLAQSPLRTQQFGQFALALERNVLAEAEPALKRFAGPVRIVWGTGDAIFSPDSPDWLDRTFPNSRGVRRLEGAKLFWPEEFPEVIAEEADKLWS